MYHDQGASPEPGARPLTRRTGRRQVAQCAATLAFALLLIGDRPAHAGPPPFTIGCTGTTGDGAGLAAAVAAANADGFDNVITLGTGCTYPIVSTLTVGPDDAGGAPRALTITGGAGPGATIDAQGVDRALWVQPGATLTLDHVLVTGGKPTSTPFVGGAIRNHYGTVNLVHSSLRENTAAAGGGAISNSGTLDIRHSTISGNSTQGYGGAIHGNGDLTLRQSVVSGNGARYDGGGIFNLSPGTLEVAGSSITTNTARAGGGIFNQSGTVDIHNSRIAGNETVNQGGGIFNIDVLTVDDAVVARNYSGAAGGGIYNKGGLVLSGVTLLGNRALRGGSDVTRSGGGGLYSINARVTIDDSSFVANHADWGGGISNVGGPSVMKIADSAVEGNTATGEGGGIYTHGQLTLDRSQVTGNAADRDGGGVFSTYVTTISKSRIAGNTAAARGGGHYVDAQQGSIVTVTGSTFSDNTATEGAGMYTAARGDSNLDDPTVSVLRSTFWGNDAAVRGGGMFVSADTSLSATNSTVSGNTVPSGEGGGLYLAVTTGVVKIWSSTITANEASTGGGIHNALAAAVQVRNTLVAANPHGGNCSGTALGPGVANLSDTAGCGAASGFMVPALPIGLGPLTYNGGTTQTHALQPGSSAINAGGPCPPIDQRGYLRTLPCDVGAFEV